MNRKSADVPDPNSARFSWDIKQCHRSGQPSKEGYTTNWKGLAVKLIGINQEQWFDDKSVPPNEILQPGFARGCDDFKKVALAWKHNHTQGRASWMSWNLCPGRELFVGLLWNARNNGQFKANVCKTIFRNTRYNFQYHHGFQNPDIIATLTLL